MIDSKGQTIRKCSICGSRNVKAMPSTHEPLRQLFKSLIRFHYNEWDYNHHFGGSSVTALFEQENPILNSVHKSKHEDLEELVLYLTENSYEEADKGVSLYAGYSDDGQNPLLDALKSSKNWTLSAYDSRLGSYDGISGLSHESIAQDKHLLAMLEEVAPLVRHVIRRGSSFFRARIGYSEKVRSDNPFDEVPYRYKPYMGQQIGAPPPDRARAGTNRAGSNLYLASDVETALSEIRPHPGHYVSIGQFKAVRRIVAFDVASIDFVQFARTDESLHQFEQLQNIEELFKRPVPPDESFKYRLSILIAATIRNLKFDGIIYGSSLGPGLNLAVFNQEAFKYAKADASVHYVEKVVTKSVPVPHVIHS